MHRAALGQLGPDLQVLVYQMAAALTSAECITTLPSLRNARAAYRLRFADGTTLKGRRFQSSRRADLARRVLQNAPPAMFGELIAHRGDAHLGAWVDGEVLGASTTDDETLAQAGRLLAQLHRIPVPKVDHDDTNVDWPARDLARLDQNLAILADRGLIDPRRAAKIARVAGGILPGRVDVGVVHGDFQPRNLIRVETRNLMIVDTGALGVGPIERDLCIVRQRWSMLEPKFASFMDAYQEVRQLPSECGTNSFWRLVVLVNSARVHSDCDSIESKRLARQMCKSELLLEVL